VHPKKDTAADIAFKKNLPGLVRIALLTISAETPMETWFQMKPGSVSREPTPISGRLLGNSL
jgi:hypothetical protein